MGAIVFIIIMALVFLVFAVLLFCGKCSFLIAGYNTASEEIRKQYNEKKLCRATSIICFTAAGLLVVMAILGYLVDYCGYSETIMAVYGAIMSAVIFGSVIWEVFYINKNCKVKD